MSNSNEPEEIKQELERVTKAFNDYKKLIQCKVLPEASTFKYIVKEVKRDLENVQFLNDALLNFIAENGLAEKYYNQFLAQDYLYNLLDFQGKNEVRYSAYGEEHFLNQVRYRLTKPDTAN